MSGERLLPGWQSLLALPVLCQGQADDLRIDTGEFRVSTSRCGLADGEPYEHTVYVEAYDFFREEPGRSGWITIGHYDGDEPPRGLPGITPHALTGWTR